MALGPWMVDRVSGLASWRRLRRPARPGCRPNVSNLALADRGDPGVQGADVVVGVEEDLEAPHPGGDRDHVKELGRLVEEDGVVLLAGERRHAAPDVSGQRL